MLMFRKNDVLEPVMAENRGEIKMDTFSVVSKYLKCSKTAFNIMTCQTLSNDAVFAYTFNVYL